jgi:N-acetylmuramoyl-L-alanine amidase
VIETYYFGPHDDERTRRLAEKENRTSGFSLASFERVIGKLKYQLKHQESKSLAASIQRNLYKHLKRNNHRLQDVGIKTAPFVVLLDANMPSVLAEVTCLNNPREAARLATPAYREHIAEYLEQGIVEYLQKNQPTLHAIRGERHDDDTKDRS